MLRVVCLAVLAGCGRLGFDAHPSGDSGASDTLVGDTAADALQAAPWAATSPLPSARYMACAVAFAGFVYVIGGNDGTAALADVIVAPILGDGSLGTWTATTALPVTTEWHACAVDLATQTIFVVGGDGGTVGLSTVFRAEIAADGSVDAWVSDLAMPGPRRGLGAGVNGGTLYALGGEAGNGFQLQDTVFGAPIGSGGALTAWSSEPTLPAADYVFGTALTDQHLYAIGGYTANTLVREAPAGQAFAQTMPLPSPLQRLASVASGNYVYALGGDASYMSPSLPDTLRAPILADGSLGAWAALGDLPVAATYPSAVAYGGRIYIFGGYDEVSMTPHAAVFVMTPPP